MANFGKPNTNNSQFFITSIECNHLNGTNVAFAYVRKGLAIVHEMEKHSTDEGVPKRPIVIADCGEILSGLNDWQQIIGDNDPTPDKFPSFPNDYEHFNTQMEVNEKLAILNTIKESGNYFYRNGNYIESSRKYKKFTRYYNYFKDIALDKEEMRMLDLLQLTSLTNLAASELKLKDYEEVIFSCSAAIKIDPNNKKAFFRRGVAHIELKNYEVALDDLKIALKLSPNNSTILLEFERAKQFLLNYRENEKKNFKKLFQ
jgi:peptidyl-prolyl isomerase D